MYIIIFIDIKNKCWQNKVLVLYFYKGKKNFYCVVYVMMNNIIYFFWSVVIGDFFVIGSVDDFLKRYKFIYIII